MSRSVPWRMSVSDACNWHQSQALNSTIYILRQTGPTGFLLQEEGESKKVKVFLGDPHMCTCPVFKKERDLCKHICWILLRKFKLSQKDPLSWQLGLVEREINEILHGRARSNQNIKKIPVGTAKVIDFSNGRNVVEQREIEADDVCPICQEELLHKKCPVTYCRFGCGNNIHIKCMRVWADHQLKSAQDGKIKCPMCREDFGPLDLLKAEMKNAGCSAPPAAGVRQDRHLGVTCSHCSVTPIDGKCYRCTVCPIFFLCQRCFNQPVHTDHTFQFRQKRNHKWRSALRMLGSHLPQALVNELMNREIQDDDYDLLLQLERNSQEELSSLTEESLKLLPVNRVKEGGSMLAPGCQCRICLRCFSVGQLIRKLPCKHKFHKDCIDSWLLHSHPSCPIDGLQVCSHTSTEDRPVSGDHPQSISSVIPSTSWKIATSLAGGRHNHQQVASHPRNIQLELSGMPIGYNPIVDQSSPQHGSTRSPVRPLVQQAGQPGQRHFTISQQILKLRNAASAPPSPACLLPPGTAHHMQSGSHQVTLGPDLASWTQDDRPRHKPYRLHGRSHSFERSVPSIQSGREIVRDLYLGNNPSTQPAVSENWANNKPPSGQRSGTRLFRPVYRRLLPPLYHLEGSSMPQDQNSADGKSTAGNDSSSQSNL